MRADVLLEPLRLSDELTLQNRIVMAPMTRCMADDELCPTADTASYYARRAAAGLIITEATIITPSGQGYPHTPGIYTDAQEAAWRLVTDRVHEQGGTIFLQLWHVGRVSHPYFHDGALPVAPSEVPLSGRVNRMPDLEYGMPRALETAEVKGLVAAYGEAARRAKAAGFDGVEIHGANGYLIDQFLRAHSNRRTDEYGGSLEARAQFALEVIEAVTAVWGAGRVGIRLSPAAYLHNEYTEGDEETYRFLLHHKCLQELAYVHTGIFNDAVVYPYLNGTATTWLREEYAGNLIACGSYTPETAVQIVKQGMCNAVAFGRLFIANPDLVEKVTDGGDLCAYNESQLNTLL